eukprot:gene12203-13342_t
MVVDGMVTQDLLPLQRCTIPIVWSDTVGNVYFTEYGSPRVRNVNFAGIINAIVGAGG